MMSFNDHLNFADPPIRPVLLELQRRTTALGPRVEEKVTDQRRITYSVARIFSEVKVQKKAILVRFFDMGLVDPRNLVRHIPYAQKQNWQHDKEIRVDNLGLVDYVMRFVEAAYNSRLTNSPPRLFGRG
jgi:predicted transport protein